MFNVAFKRPDIKSSVLQVLSQARSIRVKWEFIRNTPSETWGVATQSVLTSPVGDSNAH